MTDAAITTSSTRDLLAPRSTLLTTHVVFAILPFLAVLSSSMVALYLWGRFEENALTSSAGASAVLVSVLLPLLQFKRSLKSTAGVSQPAWILLFTVVASWMAYGISHADYFQITLNGLVLPVIAGVIYLSHRDTPLSFKVLALCVPPAAALSFLASRPGSLWPAVALISLSSFIGISTLWSAFRSAGVSGVSVGGLYASSLAQLFWVIHAAPLFKGVVVWHSLVVIALNVATAAVVHARRASS